MREPSIDAVLLVGGLINGSVFAQPQVETAAQQPDVWMTIQELPVGTRLRLTTNDGSEITGQLVTLAAAYVVVEETREGWATRRTIRRANVLSVDVVSPPSEKHMSKAAKIAIGAVVDFVVLLMVGLSAGLAHRRNRERGPIALQGRVVEKPQAVTAAR